VNVHAKQKVDGREVKDERAVAVLSNAVVRLQGSVLRERDIRNTGPGSSCARRLMAQIVGWMGKWAVERLVLCFDLWLPARSLLASCSTPQSR